MSEALVFELIDLGAKIVTNALEARDQAAAGYAVALVALRSALADTLAEVDAHLAAVDAARVAADALLAGSRQGG